MMKVGVQEMPLQTGAIAGDVQTGDEVGESLQTGAAVTRDLEP